jgi:hypothetical protein
MFFVFSCVFAVYGRPAIILSAYASPIPGSVISCSFVAELMSINVVLVVDFMVDFVSVVDDEPDFAGVVDLVDEPVVP